MSDEAVDLSGGVTLNQLVARLVKLRDEDGREGVGDLPLALEDDRGMPVTIRDIWLYWADDTEVEEPVEWRVDLS